MAYKLRVISYCIYLLWKVEGGGEALKVILEGMRLLNIYPHNYHTGHYSLPQTPVIN